MTSLALLNEVDRLRQRTELLRLAVISSEVRKSHNNSHKPENYKAMTIDLIQESQSLLNQISNYIVQYIKTDA